MKLRAHLRPRCEIKRTPQTALCNAVRTSDLADSVIAQVTSVTTTDIAVDFDWPSRWHAFQVLIASGSAPSGGTADVSVRKRLAVSILPVTISALRHWRSVPYDQSGYCTLFCARLEVISAELLKMWLCVFGWGVADVSKGLIVFRFRMNECNKCLTLQIKAIGYFEKAVSIYRATQRYFPKYLNMDVVSWSWFGWKQIQILMCLKILLFLVTELHSSKYSVLRSCKKRRREVGWAFLEVTMTPGVFSFSGRKVPQSSEATVRTSILSPNLKYRLALNP